MLVWHQPCPPMRIERRWNSNFLRLDNRSASRAFSRPLLGFEVK